MLTADKVDGVAMGTPLGPILADIFLSSIESEHMLPIIERAGLYAGYVDDTFLLLNADQDPEKVLCQLNNSHPRLKFTMEEEQNGTLNFLDVTITKNNDGAGFLTRIYRKPGIPQQFLPFTASPPSKRKEVS